MQIVLAILGVIFMYCLQLCIFTCKERIVKDLYNVNFRFGHTGVKMSSADETDNGSNELE